MATLNIHDSVQDYYVVILQCGGDAVTVLCRLVTTKTCPVFCIVTFHLHGQKALEWIQKFFLFLCVE